MLSEFLTLVPETNQFHEILNKIFRKKIKRAKVRYPNTRRSSAVFGNAMFVRSTTRLCALGSSPIEQIGGHAHPHPVVLGIFSRQPNTPHISVDQHFRDCAIYLWLIGTTCNARLPPSH